MQNGTLFWMTYKMGLPWGNSRQHSFVCSNIFVCTSYVYQIIHKPTIDTSQHWHSPQACTPWRYKDWSHFGQYQSITLSFHVVDFSTIVFLFLMIVLPKTQRKALHTHTYTITATTRCLCCRHVVCTFWVVRSNEGSIWTSLTANSLPVSLSWHRNT